MQKKYLNLVKFHNPHPGGISGCLAPLPEPLEDLIKRLDGQILDLNSTIGQLEKVIKDCGWTKYEILVRHKDDVRFIAVTRGLVTEVVSGEAERVDAWKLIEFFEYDYGYTTK